jgi:protein SCO1/2
MKRNGMAIIAPAAGLFLAAACLLSPGDAWAAGLTTPWGADSFPNVVLTTQDGKTVRFWDDLLKDKRFVINFFFTECHHNCPLETAKLAQVSRLLGDRMGKDIFFYSISLDPKRDSQKVLKAYSRRYESGRGWLFLTGRKADIELIRRGLGLSPSPGENDLLDHSSMLTMGDTKTGQWAQDAVTADPQFIAYVVRDWLSAGKDQTPSAIRVEKTPPGEGAADRGEYLFRTRCAACHTIGGGDRLGPDLLGVAEVRDKSWLNHYVASPDEVLASGDRLATGLFDRFRNVRMPNLRLGEADVDALIGFLEAQSVASHTPEKTQPQTPPLAGAEPGPSK